MNQQELIRKLQGLRSIEPNEEFVRSSRSVILSSSTGVPAGQVLKQGIFSRGLSFAMSMALAAVFLFLLAAGNTTGSFKTLFLPTLHGVNNDSLASEANTITNDIDIRLEEIQYFEQTRRAVALADSSAPQDVSSSKKLMAGEDEIDRILNEVIEY